MKGIFVVPTLAVEESFITTDAERRSSRTRTSAPYLTPDEIAWLLSPPPPSLITPQNLEFARESVRRASTPPGSRSSPARTCRPTA